MISRTRNLRSSALLCALAVLLALQPLAGSMAGNGEGLAALIKAVVCGCDACGAELESAAVESRSCCEKNADAGEKLGDACACGHPDEVPLPVPTLLCEAPAGSTHGSPQAFLAQHSAVSAATLDPLSRGACASRTPGARRHRGPPGPRPPAAGDDGSGSPLGLDDGMPTRLAVLCCALV